MSVSVQDLQLTSPAPGPAQGHSARIIPVAVRPCLNMLRLELVFRFMDVAWLPPFRGSLWRSILGPALKRLDKREEWRPPHEKKLPRSLYDWVFHTPASANLATPKDGCAPHPLIVDAPATKDWVFVPKGQTMRIQLTLVGHFANAWQQIIMAFADAGQRGIGKAITREGRRGRAKLISVHQVWTKDHLDQPLWNAQNGWTTKAPDPAFVPAPTPGPVHLQFVSPLRIEHKKRIVTPEKFTGADLFAPLIRRTKALMASHGGVVLKVNQQRLLDQARAMTFYNANMTWRDGARWSASQKNQVPCGGIVGSCDLDMAQYPLLFEFLWLAQWINIGKGAFMGLGNIRLSPL